MKYSQKKDHDKIKTWMKESILFESYWS